MMTSIFNEQVEKTTGEVIKTYRKYYRIKQDGLADLLQITQPYLSAIENDKRNLGLDLALKISAIFSISLEKLLYPDTQKNEMIIRVMSYRIKEKGLERLIKYHRDRLSLEQKSSVSYSLSKRKNCIDI